HQESDPHQHAQDEHVRRKGRRAEEQRCHGDQSGHSTDDEDNASGTDQTVTGRRGIRLGFVTHWTRVVPWPRNQTVVAGVLEAKAEPVFHPDSYGYRPGRSGSDGVGRCRERCWEAGWGNDLDIRAFFDSVPWDLVLKAVAAHTDPSQSWVLLYVRRWLAAPLQLPDGTRRERDRGTPQGSSVSPVLANLFLHYAFDAWMARDFPASGFERYVDGAVVQCVSERQARCVLAAIEKRRGEVGLELHPEKTRIVYCQDANRRASYEHTEFTFLGFTFRTRSAV